ncbi:MULTISPECIES: CHAT domain-containing protein [unclassified Mycolicibacterium]|uniref:CHAT domain-containing protein n=1 Tax=unclassified Mycolicibacterium TaxID=2636767 RepID=UPI002EDAC6FA
MTESGADRRMVLAREWDELVERVRNIDGLDSFLRPPPVRALVAAATHGPIAVLNVNTRRCDALLVTSNGVRGFPLPGLTLDDSAQRLALYLHSLQRFDAAVATVVDARHLAQSQASHRNTLAAHRAGLELASAERDVDAMLTDLQGWLWETVCRPVLDALGLDRPPTAGQPWPRVWWCPTGPLTLLPLHAAGYHDGSRASVLDRCVSSYTPTVQALAQARRATVTQTGDLNRMLVVAAPGFAEAAPDDSARQPYRAEPGLRTTIAADAATRAVVLRELGLHRMVHFDCHGEQDLDAPSSGGLMLADGRLTILEIAAQSFRGDFAGLAACKTAVGGVELLDEAISLTAALHYTGYRHVVGSLWSIRDDVARQGFARLYELMDADGALDADQSPLALHSVSRELRDIHLPNPRLWAPFIHVGP